MLPKKIKVLIVDDEQIFIHFLSSQILNHFEEPEIVIAYDGLDALHKFRVAYEAGDPFALVITDYQMPNMNGLEFAHKVRERCPKCKIILYTTSHRPHLPDLIDIDIHILKDNSTSVNLQRALNIFFAHS